jgi:hypothetical protein
MGNIGRCIHFNTNTKMNELKTQFKAETKGYIHADTDREECYSDVYVEWLEQQIKELKELVKELEGWIGYMPNKLDKRIKQALKK